MSVTFSGLASGIDTDSIIDSIIEVEGATVETLEDKQAYLESKLEVYSEFNSLLETFSSSVMSLNSESDLATFDISNNGSQYFSIATTSISEEGSYSVEVVSLARQQKDISEEGFADTDTTTLSGTLQFGDETLEYADVTLEELVELINEGDYGLSASIVDVGTESGNRLLLTADSAGDSIAIVGSGSITLDTETDGHTVDGTLAQVTIDGIDYFSSSNSITSAIKGTTITLLEESESGADSLTLTSNADETITTVLEELVAAYNTIVEYIDGIAEGDPTLGASLKTVQRSLKNYLTDDRLLALGISTDWETGELTFDEETFSTLWENDAASVIESLVGEDGIMVTFDGYMEEQLDSSDGFLAVKKSTVDEQITDLDDRIDVLETRLEKRRETLEAQFSAMETLLSTLNSQADYLTTFFESYSSD